MPEDEVVAETPVATDTATPADDSDLSKRVLPGSATFGEVRKDAVDDYPERPSEEALMPAGTEEGQRDYSHAYEDPSTNREISVTPPDPNQVRREAPTKKQFDRPADVEKRG